jgi:integrase
MAQVTDAQLRKLKRPEKGRVEVYDDTLPGFGYRATAKVISFFYYSRVMRNGVSRKQRFVLGEYGSDGEGGKITLAQARLQAETIRNRIDKGEDLRAEAIEAKQAADTDAANTFRLAAQRFMTRHVRKDYAKPEGNAASVNSKRRKSAPKPLRPATVAGYKWALCGDVTRQWEDRPLKSIGKRDVKGVIREFEDTDRLATARLWRAYINRFFEWCREEYDMDTNPAETVSVAFSAADAARTRALTVDELREVLTAANTLNDPYRSFIHVLALCGQRRRETSLMRWADIDLESENPVWQIPATITKNHRPHSVPLVGVVVELIRKLPRLEKDGRVCPFVFSTDGVTPISGFSKFKTKLDEAISAARKIKNPRVPEIEHWSLHDLRRTISTRLNDSGVPPHVVEAILNHISGTRAGVAGTYNRSQYDTDRRRALEGWAKLALGTTESANVLPFHQGISHG